jgi:NDP-sugar pyrophosphorylase family protein
VRLNPFTKILPKPLMPIGEKPIIEIIINRFFDYGCKDFYLSLNYKSNIIKAYFSDFEHEYKINYILENKPLGTAGSLHLLKNMIKKTFFVSNCDILIEADYADILKFHYQRKNKITLVSSMKNFTIPYGVCEIQNGGILKNIREKPEYDFLVNTGMYVVEAAVLADIPKNQFYNITELINDYLKKGEKVGVYPVSEKSWIDMGQFEALQETLKKFEV